MPPKKVKPIEDIKEPEIYEDEPPTEPYDSETDTSSSVSIVLTKPTKQPKEKKPYVLTPARKAQFEKARIIRDENRAKNKLIKDEADKKHEENKNDIIRKKELKTIRKKTREIKALVETGNSSSEEEQVVIKKKPKKKKIVYVEETSSDEEIIIKKKTNKVKLPDTSPPQKEVRRIIQYF